MKLQQYVARQTERMAESLAHFVAATPDDCLVWHPASGDGHARSALEQIGECVSVNRYMAALLRAEAVSPPQGGWPDVQFANGQDAQEQLVASAREAAAAIEALPDAALHEHFQLRRGPTPGENLIMMPYRNMAYHAGQVNLIQVLAGDTEFHVPASWY